MEKQETLTDYILKNYFDTAFKNLQLARDNIVKASKKAENIVDLEFCKEKIKKLNKAIDLLLDL